MLGWTGSHQFRRGAVSDPPQWLERAGVCAGAVRALSLSAFSQKASALAEGLSGICAGRFTRPGAQGLDRDTLFAAKPESLAGRSWVGGWLCGDLHGANAQPFSMVTSSA